MPADAADEAVGRAGVDHEQAVQRRVVEQRRRLDGRDALAAAESQEPVEVAVAVRRVGRVDDLDVAELETQVAHLEPHQRRVAQKDRARDALLDHDLAGAQDLLVRAFGEDDALGTAAGADAHPPQELALEPEQALEAVAIGLGIDLAARHARGDRGLGDGGRDPQQRAPSNGFGMMYSGPKRNESTP